ncbi:MAG: hypothetical protein SGPRY_009920 [Prymnesium sp.]
MLHCVGLVSAAITVPMAVLMTVFVVMFMAIMRVGVSVGVRVILALFACVQPRGGKGGTHGLHEFILTDVANRFVHLEDDGIWLTEYAHHGLQWRTARLSTPQLAHHPRLLIQRSRELLFLRYDKAR